jgi:hypothetical protein
MKRQIHSLSGSCPTDCIIFLLLNCAGKLILPGGEGHTYRVKSFRSSRHCILLRPLINNELLLFYNPLIVHYRKIIHPCRSIIHR